MVRVAFGVAWALLCRWTPNPMHGWRAVVVRIFGGKIGRGVFLYPDVKIWYPPNLTMKAASTLGPGVRCYAMAPIEIGTKAIVSQGVHLCAGTHDIDDTHFQLRAAPITIGDFAWVAAEAFVGPGVTIGMGAVLGARGVTVKEIPAWTVYAGNPARYIRDRKGRPN